MIVPINGTELHVEESGSGTPLVFVHGTGGGTFLFDRIVRLLPEFRCIRYDRRGNAASAPDAGPNRGIEGDADDLAALVDALKLESVVLVGLSWGSAIVIDVLRRYPHFCDRAVLGEPTVFSLDPPGAAAIVELLQQRIAAAVQHGGPRAAVEAFYSTACGSFWQMLDDDEREAYRNNAHGMFRDLEAPAYAIAPDDLPSISSHCAILIGDAPSPFHATVAGVVAQHLANSEYIEISNSGHVVFGEQPRACAEVIRRFVRQDTGS